MKNLIETLLNLLAEFSMSMYPLCQTQPVRLPVPAPEARERNATAPHAPPLPN